MQGARVQSLFGEPGSCMPRGMAKNRKKQTHKPDEILFQDKLSEQLVRIIMRNIMLQITNSKPDTWVSKDKRAAAVWDTAVSTLSVAEESYLWVSTFPQIWKLSPLNIFLKLMLLLLSTIPAINKLNDLQKEVVFMWCILTIIVHGWVFSEHFTNSLQLAFIHKALCWAQKGMKVDKCILKSQSMLPGRLRSSTLGV